jgi:hypothetical protein
MVGGKYHVYFTARDTTGRLCIGVAVSNKPQGPYVDPIGKQLLKKPDMGTIDATIMPVGNDTYLVWKGKYLNT